MRVCGYPEWAFKKVEEMMRNGKNRKRQKEKQRKKSVDPNKDG